MTTIKTNAEIEAKIAKLKQTVFAANGGQKFIDEIVSIVNLINTGAAPAKRSGTAIKFDAQATYGYTVPEEGVLTFDPTDFEEGITQVVIHNGSDPAIAEVPEFKLVVGAYQEGIDNYIMLHSLKPNLILVSISQPI